jgi:dihydroorotate dehydrogenase electron transfer subunit
MQLSLRGPLGSGFRLPVSARRVALAGLEGSAARLLPLAYQALVQQAAVTIFSDFTPAGLPPDMEVLPLDLLAEAPAWADFLALDVLPSTLPTLRSTLGLKSFSHPPCIVQVLIRTSMPCTGLGECGVCAVPTHAGWKLVCSDGPVFDFNALELGG